MVKSEHLSIIKKLQSLGHQVVFIDDTYFVASSFNAADENTHFHSLDGIDCTELVKTKVATNVRDKSDQEEIQGIITKLLDTVQETQHFSKDTPWRCFFSTKNKF